MIEKGYTKYQSGGIVFHMIGTRREHLELSEKIKFLYKNYECIYECYVEDIPDINIDNLDDLEDFDIIAVKRINNDKKSI